MFHAASGRFIYNPLFRMREKFCEAPRRRRRDPVKELVKS